MKDELRSARRLDIKVRNYDIARISRCLQKKKRNKYFMESKHFLERDVTSRMQFCHLRASPAQGKG